MNFSCDTTTFQQLSTLTERLVNTLLIDQIYLYQYEQEGVNQQEVVVLLPHTNKQFITEATPLVNMVMSNSTPFRTRIHYVHEVRQSIKQGGIALLCRCQPDNLLYLNPQSACVGASKKFSFEKVFQKATENLRLEQRKIVAFKEGVQFYLDRNNLQLCAFMLHQLFELCYRMGEIILFGREKTSHSLRNHLHLVLPYIPDIKTIFDKNNESDMGLIEVLDRAYLSVRYDNNYHITERDLDCLMDKSQDLVALITTTCENVLDEFKRRQ